MPDALGCSICPFSEGLDLLAHGAHAQHICTTGWCCSLEVGRAQQQLHDPLRHLARHANTVVSGFIDWKHGWSGMYTFASGSSPRTMRNKSSNVSFGHGLFPQGGSLAECAKGSYDDEQREVARRLAANGVGDAEIRLGWEASGDWFPWSAAGKPADQWKACFTNIAKAMKGQASGLRIGWFMAKKGRIDARTIYPADAPITNIGLSFYDDGQARFGTETYLGGPWGLQAWANFARGKGKKLAFGEWGVGRNGDNPAFIDEYVQLPRREQRRHRARGLLQLGLVSAVPH